MQKGLYKLLEEEDKIDKNHFNIGNCSLNLLIYSIMQGVLIIMEFKYIVKKFPWMFFFNLWELRKHHVKVLESKNSSVNDVLVQSSHNESRNIKHNIVWMQTVSRVDWHYAIRKLGTLSKYIYFCQKLMYDDLIRETHMASLISLMCFYTIYK